MTKEQEMEKYVERFGANCFLCGSFTEPKDRVLVQSIVKMDHTRDEYTNPYVFQYYIACPTCREKGVIV
jgi:hypothetical protein